LHSGRVRRFGLPRNSQHRNQQEQTTKKPPAAAMVKKSDFHVREVLEIGDFRFVICD